MLRSIAVAYTAILIMVLGGCATTSLSDASRKLAVGMMEQDVTTLVGSEPKSVSLMTCGSNTGKPWQCKVYDYKNHWNGGWLIIHFSHDASGTWRVNDWSYL